MNRLIKLVLVCSMLVTVIVLYGCANKEEVNETKKVIRDFSTLSTALNSSITQDDAVEHLSKVFDEAKIRNEIQVDKDHSLIQVVLYPFNAKTCKIFDGYENWGTSQKEATRKSLDWDSVVAETQSINKTFCKVAKDAGFRDSVLVLVSDDGKDVLMFFVNDEFKYNILT